MKAMIVALCSVVVAPAGCSQIGRALLHELGIVAERGGGAATRNAERDAAESAAHARPVSWANGVNSDGDSYWLSAGGARVSRAAISAFMRTHGYSSSGSPGVDQDSQREVATYRLEGTLTFSPPTCLRSDGSMYQVPHDAVACLDGRVPMAGAALDISAIPVE